MADHSQTQHGLSRLRRALWLSSILSLSALLAVSQAQITLDGSLGPRMPLTGPTYRIEATMGQIRGRNLFHSFGQFNVRTDERVTFAGPNTIANIVSRVTGGSPSSIDGTMGSDIPEANLYLLNPAGVMFGPNARLDVSGSFHVSTADFLRFTDGAKFFVSMGQDSVLTCAAPTAFGFLGPMPAPITIQGSGLQGAPGSALAVVGGDITLGGGRLQATSGRIQLASVASPGEVVFSPLELAPDLQVDSFTRLGQIKLSQVSLLANGNGGGTVLIRGGRLVADNALINANTNGARDGARLGIDLHMADEIVLTNVNIFANSTGGAGRGGDIQITTGRLQVLGARSSISSSVLSSGDGGNITVSVNRFEMEGGPVGFNVVGVSVGDPTSAMIPLGATGKVGVLTVSARDSITLSGAASRLLATVGTASLGDAGSVSLWTPTLTMDKGGLIQAITLGNGNAGAIGVRVGRLTLTGGAQISSSTRSVGRGGQVTVEAADSISIAGQDSVGHASGLFSQATASGDAGSVMVKVGRLALTDGGQISTSSSGPGRGGQVTVEATDAIAISGRGSMGPSGLFSSTQAFGQGGTLQIAANQLQLSDGATISASSTGTGDAGPIQLQVGETFRSQNSLVTTATTESGGVRSP
jgi:filamentous hemagglutinin family protein